MQWISELWRRLVFFLRRGQFHCDLEEEMRLHQDLRPRALSENGRPPEEAYYAAQREFGNALLLCEQSYDAWGFMWLETLRQDVRYSLRQLRRNSGFTIVAVLTLALGIGANTAIFSVVNGILLRPLPLENPDELVLVWQRVPHFGVNMFTTPDFMAWNNQALLPIAGVTAESFNVNGRERPEHVTGGPVSANYFSLLGAKPFLGRTFLPQEDRPGGGHVAILSYGLWQRAFAGEPSIIGRAVDLNSELFTVVGIMPRSFHDPVINNQQLWIPLRSDPTFGATRRSESVHWLFVLGRLKPGFNLNQARSAIAALAVNLGKAYPHTDARLGISIDLLNNYVVGDVRPALLILLVSVGFVLLIACANVANLLLARATTRAKELAIRITLGAGHARLVCQLLTESVLLSLLGGALGLLFAFWTIGLLRALKPGNIPRLKEVVIDPRVLVFTLVLSVVTGIIFGLAPAIRSTKTELNETLKDGGWTSHSSYGRRDLRHLLVISEVALALVLLIGVGLMVRSFRSIERAKLGFNPHHLLTLQIAFAPPSGTPARQMPLFYQQVIERIRQLPGIESAALARDLPLVGANPSMPFSIAGHPAASPQQRPIARYRAVSSGYFRTLGVPLLRGRDFTAQDTQGAPCVVLINQAMVHRFWPRKNPVGQQIKPAWGYDNWCTIVGAVGNVKKGGPEFPVFETMYYSYLQVPFSTLPLVEGSMRLAIRTALPPQNLVGAIRREVATVNKDIPIYNIRTMDEIVSASMARARFNMLLLGAFGLIAMLMAVAGIYGVISYSISQRTHEIGIRMALGAQKSDVLKLVVKQGLALVLIGAGAGIVVALGLTRLMASLLYGVKPDDLAAFAAMPLMLITVALLACYIPARRAAKVDPMVALRHE